MKGNYYYISIIVIHTRMISFEIRLKNLNILDPIVIPKFISHYIIYTFLLVSIIEGVILNLGLKLAFYKPKGLLISAMLNFATIFTSFFVLRVIYFDNINYNFIMGFVLCTGVEFYFADFMLAKDIKKQRLLVTITIANLISYLLVWLNADWLF